MHEKKKSRAKKEAEGGGHDRSKSEENLCNVGQGPEARLAELVVNAVVVDEPSTGPMQQPPTETRS